MKNFIQNGDTITLLAPHNLISGDGMLVGAIFGIACNDALAGTEIEAKLTGVFTMSKAATESWSAGDLIYWDKAANLATSIAGSNALIGVSIASAANLSAVGTVRLNGTFAGVLTSVYNEEKLVHSESVRHYNSTPEHEESE
jgi:predicted RecA/RadA family phage recombinase